MNILVTGGAGFIGRWVVKLLIEQKHNVAVIDDLSTGQKKNLDEFKNLKFIHGDITNKKDVEKCFNGRIDVCIHIAAQTDVQESLDNPKKSIDVNILGTFNLLEKAREQKIKFVFVSTCMVYEMAEKEINELHSVKPISPYGATKLGAEQLVLSYHYGYGMPAVILRPFNTYGPYQKTNMEGSVVSIFINKKLRGKDIEIFGDGQQTRDLLYAEDCADFIVKAAFSEKAVGKIINAGTGKEVSINELAVMIYGEKNRNKVKNIKHHHPQSDIRRLLCDSSKAERLLNWKARTSLTEGIRKTEEWLKKEGN